MTAVAEDLEPPELFAWFKSKREAIGIRIEPLDDHAGTVLLQTLKEGGVVGLLCDRDIQGNGIETAFFGARASIPAGAVELARATGASLVPVYSRRLRGGGSVVTVQPPLDLIDTGAREADLRTNTAALMQRFEAQIRADPGQWLVLQPLWNQQ